MSSSLSCSSCDSVSSCQLTSSSSTSTSSSSTSSSTQSCQTECCSIQNLQSCNQCDENSCSVNFSNKLLVKRLNSNASLPSKQHSDDAGYDLSACLDSPITLAPHERVLVSTGLSVAIPVGHYGRIAPRSGLALKNGIDILAGVVDSGYRNEVKVILYNTSSESFVIKHGDRIAQLIIEVIKNLDVTEVSTLPSAQRNLGGFGSTGV